MKLGHETLPQLSMDPTRSRSGGHSPTKPPKEPMAPLEPGSYEEALLTFRPATLLDHPEEKLSLADQDLVFTEIRRVFCKTPNGGCPLL